MGHAAGRAWWEPIIGERGRDRAEHAGGEPNAEANAEANETRQRFHEAR